MPESGPELFRIGELAKRSGCSRRQIQDFLVMGLIKAESTTAGGQHLFGEETVRRLKLVRQVLESGGKEYTMAELIRTFKQFLKAAALVVSLLWAAAAGGATTAAAAAEPAPPPTPAVQELPLGNAALTAADRAAVRRLFDGFCKMMTAGDADRVRGLLSAELPPERLQAVLDGLQAEFRSYSYRSFTCEYLPAEDIEVLGPGRARLSAVLRWEYWEQDGRGASGDAHGDRVGQAFEFDLVREGAEWRIAGDEFFDRLSASQSTIFSRIFLWAAVGLVVFSFWGWMLLDCCFRDWAGRRGPWVTALVLALAAGAAAVYFRQAGGESWLLAVAPAPAAMALVYFFAVWMRQGAED